MTSPTKCPYNICGGNGHYIVVENGFEFGRECKCYKELIAKNKLDFAQIPEVFRELSIGEFDINIYKKPESREQAELAKGLAMQYVKRFESMKEKGRGLYFYSKEAGSGKTRLAVSIGNSLIKYKKQNVRFINTVELLGKIRDSWNDKSKHSEEELVSEFAKAPVLILDDIGVEGNKDWINNIFYRIMNDRLTANKVTIITSNTPMNKLEFSYQLKNRMEAMVMEVIMPEESVRSILSKSKNEMMMEELLGGSR